MPLDTNIPLSGLAQRPLDVMGIYAKGLDLQNAQLENQVKVTAHQATQRAQQEAVLLSDIYKSAVGEDGQVDRKSLLSGVAKGGLGKLVPALQKSFLETDKAKGDIDKHRADTDKVALETLHAGLKYIDNSLSSLVANPQVNDRMVMAEMGRLVSLGAFNAQAAQVGKTPDKYATDLVATMPVGNPQALRGWLTQAGMRVMDASKRVEMQMPKYDEQDRGGVINQGTLDLMTGQRTPGNDIAKTITPDAQLSANTTTRGQNLQHTAMTDANQIAREAAQSQVVDTPQGYAVVNKGAGDARPVRMSNGQPVLSKDASAAKNASMARAMTDAIPYARTLLNSGPTASGAGAQADKIAGYIGLELKSKDTAGQLETLSGWMTSNVPRFEGPQGVQDVIIYQQMSGTVGDRTKSVSERLKALDTVDNLMSKYKNVPGTQPIGSVPPRPAVPTREFAPVVRGAAGRAAVQGNTPSLDSFFK